jgi:hypothetical protein
MTQQNPITPPDELVQQWWDDFNGAFYEFEAITATVFQAGADQELEACCEWLGQKVLLQHQSDVVPALRAARRPKPPSLKEQALKELTWVDKHLNMPLHNHCTAIHTIRRALEQLPDNE